MNTTPSSTLAFLSDASDSQVRELGALVLVDDFSYEFVGGGMAANGL